MSEQFPHPKTPDTIVTNTGETEYAIEAGELFFRDIREYINEELGAHPAEFDTVSRPVVATEYPAGETAQLSDDRLTLLLFRDRIAGLILERRNERNYVEYVFAEYVDQFRPRSI